MLRDDIVELIAEFGGIDVRRALNFPPRRLTLPSLNIDKLHQYSQRGHVILHINETYSYRIEYSYRLGARKVLVPVPGRNNQVHCVLCVDPAYDELFGILRPVAVHARVHRIKWYRSQLGIVSV